MIMIDTNFVSKESLGTSIKMNKFTAKIDSARLEEEYFVNHSGSKEGRKIQKKIYFKATVTDHSGTKSDFQ